MTVDKRERCDWCLEWRLIERIHDVAANAKKCDDCYFWDRQHPDIARLLESGI